MPQVKLDRVFSLMQEGIYSGCLAIITDQEASDEALGRLSKRAQRRFQSVHHLNLVKDNPDHIVRCGTDLVMLNGLERCSPQNSATYVVRTALDVRRNSGLFSIVCLNSEAFKDHFCHRAHPFYHFCGAIEQGQICDFNEQ